MFGRVEELLEIDLSFLEPWELFLIAVLLFAVPFLLLRCTVDLEMVLFPRLTLLLLDAVLLVAVLFFL